MESNANERMTTMNVSLPESLRDFIQSRISDGFGSVSEYVRELVRRDQREAERGEVEKRLLAALESPKSEMTSADWKELRETLKKRHSRK